MSPMEVEEKVRENKLRRVAERRGFQIVKSRRKDPQAVDFGGYMLTDIRTNAVVLGSGAFAYSATLEDIENYFGLKADKTGKAKSKAKKTY